MNIARQRLSRTFLTGSDFRTGREVVRALGAVQAQDYAGAKWALGQRATGTTDESIEREFTAADILRTHVLRPTWHFVDPADIRWMLVLTAPRIKQAMSSYDRKLGLDATVYRRSNAAIARALRDGAFLTRTELKAMLARARVGALGGQRMAHLMMRAELDAVVCSGPRRGRQFTYALLDARVPTAPPVDRDESLLQLARIYFRTRGPATAHDFGWWSGLAMADVRRAIDLAKAGVESIRVDDGTYYVTADPIARSSPTAHLLPNYDEFFIGHRDRSAIGRRLSSVKAVTGGNALIAHVIVVDGQLVGGWRRTAAAAGITVDLTLLATLTDAEQRRVQRALARFHAFAGQPVHVRGLGKTARTKSVR